MAINFEAMEPVGGGAQVPDEANSKKGDSWDMVIDIYIYNQQELEVTHNCIYIYNYIYITDLFFEDVGSLIIPKMMVIQS